MRSAYEVTQKIITDDDGLVTVEIVRIREIDVDKRYSQKDEEEEEEEE